jgi:hypothetical protein
VLRLPDADNALAGPVNPARPGVLTIWVASPAEARPCLVADLVARVAGRHHLRAIVSGPAPADWAELNVYPAGVTAGPPEPLDVTVGPAVGPAGGAAAPAAHRVEPGAAGPVDLTGLDPLALRLALMQRPYRAGADFTPDDLKAAGEILTGWRGLVRHWALSPSKPMCAQYAGDFLAALDDDLDTPAALRTLAALAADPVIPDGSKFETFAHLDRFLGLDLAREVGR